MRRNKKQTDLNYKRGNKKVSKISNSNKKSSSTFKKSFRNLFLFFLFTFLIITFAVAGVGFGIYMKIIKDAPKLDLLAIQPNMYTSIVYDMNKNEIDRFHGEENREYVSLEEIPVNLQNALIAVEDERFFSHSGIDIKGIIRAGITTIKSKLTGSSRVEGASTITQQLIKNNVTKVTRNTIKTKIQELYLAINYEKQLTQELGNKKSAKKYILELYLNTIALGHGYNGVQSAAIGYFNKNVSDLTLAECASIASITNNPTLYSPRINPENNNARSQRVLNKMLEQNMITEEEYNTALNEDIYSKVSANYKQQLEEGGNIHSYFIDSVFQQVSLDLQDKYNISKAQANNLIYNGGLEIITTQDSSIQEVLDETFLDESLFPNVKYSLDVVYTVSIGNKNTDKQNHYEYRQFVKNKEEANNFIENKKREIENSLKENEYIVADRENINIQPQAAMVIMDQSNGEVRALIGGRGDKEVNRGFNRSVDSLRQPGSTFKILSAFAPGIDLGTLTPATVFEDEPYTIGEYSPSNWYKGYRGKASIRDAIRDSMNIIAVKSMVSTGIDKSYNYLLNFGFTSLEDDKHASTALGGITNGVSQLELTTAFASIANGGTYFAPRLYTEVLDRNGEVLLDNKNVKNKKQVLKETSAFLLTNMMQDVVTSGTGAKAKFLNSKMPIAGKTGTTQDSRDLTFVGYTPYYTAGIWLGYDRYDSTVSNMNNLSQSSHLIIWRNVMEKIHKNLSTKQFEKPQEITTAVICKDSGLLTGEFCPENKIKTEYFAEGTHPVEVCNIHNSIKICKDSNLLAGEFCPDITNFVSNKVDEVGNIITPPTSICDIHFEDSIVITPQIKEENNFNSQELTDINNEVSLDNDDILGNIIPSTPNNSLNTSIDNTNNNLNSQTNNNIEFIEEPLIDTPN